MNNFGLSCKLSCVLGETINRNFLKACAAEFIASFGMLWLLTGVSSAIGYLPIPIDITTNHMMATIGSVMGENNNPVLNFHHSGIPNTGTFQRPQNNAVVDMFPYTNVQAVHGPVGGVLNALGYETGLLFSFDRTLGYSLVYGLSNAVLSYCVVNFSGAHLNPIVSLSLAMSGNCTWLRALFYWAFQFGGAISAAGWLKLSVGSTFYLGGLLPRLPVEQGHGFLLEFWGSVLLLLPYLFFAPHVARTFEPTIPLTANAVSSLSPLICGLMLCVCSIVIHPFTGCALNPARAMAGAVFDQRQYTKPFAAFGFPQHWWIYWIGPIGAAVITPILFLLITNTCSLFDEFKFRESTPRQSLTTV